MQASVARLEQALENATTTFVDAKNGLSFPRVDCVIAARGLTENIFLDSFGN